MVNVSKNTKICPLCGNSFVPIGGQRYCKGDHYKECKNCGKMFKIPYPSYASCTCSKECANQFRRNQRINNGKFNKVCIVCGEEFTTSSKSRTVCYSEHHKKCIICGKDFVVDPYNALVETCGDYECRHQKSELTNLERYGVRNVMQCEEVKASLRSSMLEKYGVEFSVHSEEIMDKLRSNNLEKYGVEYCVQREDVKQKSRETCLERYGVDNIFKDLNFRKHAQEVFQERYGVDNPFKSEELREKGRQTSLERYGTEFPQQSQEIRSKMSRSNILNFAKNISDERKRKEYLEFRSDPKSYLEKKFSENPNIRPKDIADKVGYADSLVILNKIHENDLEYLDKYLHEPTMELDIKEFILSIDENVQLFQNYRRAIKPKEIDLYLPEYNVGIECNPTATHNSTISFSEILNYSPGELIPTDYHKVKTDLAVDNGIFLLHVFGYEWKAKREIIQSMIRNLLHKNMYKYYARKLTLREVRSSMAKIFLDSNHRQGYTSSSVDLISIMTFGKTRKTISKSNSDTSDTWELLRFCNKLNTSVVGGASKLFKFFIDNYSYDKIVSYSDRAHTQGKIYDVLGFQKISVSEPGYCWVSLYDDMYLSRASCQKRNLPKLFNQPDLDIENKTEQQIMVEHGFVQVFDSGTIRWEYTK